ncbi:MAG: indole-3-glycerol phosphate synthase TrpC [Clostridiales bacterium]|nr:indole-3-glycerol phosphate synthase TrpC [Clostridiales bacterium]
MILDKIVEDKKFRLAEHKARISLQDMRRMAEEYDGISPSFREGLMKPGISIIGEFKKASPSLGKITSKIDLTDRIDEYNDSVDCISCLTEEDHFLGNVDYLKEIRALSPLPILRKDFMIDEYQFYEAKAIGANAILLITGILDDVQLRDFYQLTTELGLDALFEAHDESQMDRALRCGAQIVGVNNRDLRDFSIHLETTKVLSKMVPEDWTFVAESGIVSDADVAFLAECRVDAFLIGRAFMESENPRRLARHWKEVYEGKMNGI